MKNAQVFEFSMNTTEKTSLGNETPNGDSGDMQNKVSFSRQGVG